MKEELITKKQYKNSKYVADWLYKGKYFAYKFSDENRITISTNLYRYKNKLNMFWVNFYSLEVVDGNIFGKYCKIIGD